jgi:hypothetical protein
MSDQKRFSIKSAAAALDLSEVYIRRMIQQGKLATIKTQIGDTEVWKHEIEEAELNKWRKGAGTRTSRTDGRSKYTLYATAEELKSIQGLLATHKVAAVVERANKPEDTKRRYAAQKARRMAKKAAAKAQAKPTTK